MSVDERLCLLRKAARRDQMQHVVAPTEHIRLVGATQARRGFNQRIENRLEVDRRAADDLEHITSRGELINRTREFGLAVAQLVEQARILDGDDRLVGEAGGELDLFARKRIDACALNDEYADQRVLAQQRNAEHRAKAGELLSFPISVFWVLQDIRDVHHSALQLYPAADGAAVGRKGVSADEIPYLLGKATRREHVILVIAAPKHERLVGTAEARGGFHQRVDDCLEVDGRAADSLEHVCGRGLLLKGFPQFLEQPCILDRDDGLFGEVAEQLDLLIRERTNFLAEYIDAPDQFGVLEHRDNEYRPGARQFAARNI